MDIRLVRTDIAGFFGFTERGPVVNRTTVDPSRQLKAAVKVTSWNDFRNKFGGYLTNGYLAYAVRGFFATGGTTCYVVRVGAASVPATTALLPLPAAITPPLITYVGAAIAPDQAQIQLDSADVVSVGDLIGINDPLTGECVSVASIVDDQTITVQPPLVSGYAAGVPVYSIQGSPLQSTVAAGATSVQVASIGGFNSGDLIGIQGGGVSEVRVISTTSADGTIIFELPLYFPYPIVQGSPPGVVRVFPAALTATAQSAGAWGNGIQLQITPLDSTDTNAVTHFALRITVDQGDDPLQPVQEEYYPLLSMDPNDPSPTPIYAPTVVNAASQIICLNAPPQAPGVPVPQLLVNAGPLANGNAYLQGGSDGTEAATVTTNDFLAALEVLSMVDEVAILCCPDAVGPPPIQTSTYVMPPPIVSGPCNGQSAAATQTYATTAAPVAPGWSATAIQQAMVAQCAQLQYRVAVLDSPMASQGLPGNITSMLPSQVPTWLAGLGVPASSQKFAAVYYPWIKVPDELAVQGPNRTIPPSGHVAGAYAYTDNTFGVQKPPANVQLQFISDVDLAVTDQQQGFLNPAGINAIRPIPGRGIRVWGARSISTDPDWRYIHFRRLLSMIEDSVEKTSQWVVFQSNDDNLRRMLTHSLNTFLRAIWLTGGLQGTVATDGYYVICDSTNNPQSSIDAGFLICQVGVAIAAPMEFLVFELRRSVAGSQVVEA